MRKKVTAMVEKGSGERSFACYVKDDLPGFGLTGYGNTAKEAIEDLHVAYDEIREMFREQGKEVPELEISYKFDIGSLFSYYDFLNMGAVAKRAGINQSKMRQYAMGMHKPSDERKKHIASTLAQLSKEMQAVVL